MKKLILSALFLSIVSVCKAQQFYTPPTDQEIKHGEIYVAAVSVEVKDGIATTTLDLKFSHRGYQYQDEGIVEFSLLPHQHISQFQLDVNGTLRDAMVVEKQKGRAAYEEIISRRVDPGLLEMIGENKYRLRVYPISRFGLKRAVLVYEEKLPRMSDKYIYTLPLGYNYPVFENIRSNYSGEKHLFTLKMTVPYETYPRIEESPLDAIQFETKPGSISEFFIGADSIPQGVLTVSMTAPDAQKPELLLEKTKSGTDRVFLLQTTSPLKPVDKPKPGKVALCIDRSLSMQPISPKVLELMQRYIKHIDHLSVEVYTIGTDIRKTGSYDIRQGDPAALFRHIGEIEFNGVARFDSLDLSFPECDEVWLLTDGVSPISSNPSCKTGSHPVIILNDSKQADSYWISQLAERTGGACINLGQPIVADPLSLLTTKQPHLVLTDYSSKQIEDLHVRTIRHSDLTKSYLITGKQKKNKAQLILHFKMGSDLLCDTLYLDNNQTGKYNGFVERAYLNEKIKSLNADPNQMKEITEIGTKYSLVTPNTSLIVLETLEDYIKYEIVPPTDDLQRDYFRNLERIKREEEENSWKKDEALKEAFNDRRMAWKAFASDKEIAAFDHYIEKRTERRQRAEQRREKMRKYWEEAERRRKREEWEMNNPPQYYRPKKRKRGTYGGYSGPSTVRQSGTLLSEASTRRITGKVVDERGEPVIGCSVYVVGTNIGVCSDLDGEFALTLPANAKKMKVSLIGMNPAEYEVTHTNAKITLGEESIELSDVVVTGYSGPSISSEPAPIQQEPIIKDQGNETAYFPSLPDSLYLPGLEALQPEEILRQYPALRQVYGTSPFFYLSVANLLHEKGDSDAAYQVVSNLAEMSVGNPNLLLPYTKFIVQLGRTEEAIKILETNVVQHPDKLISYRELALAYAAAKQYQKAVDCIYSTLSLPFSDEDKVMILTDMNNIIVWAKRENEKLKLSEIESRFIFPITAGQRFVVGSFSDARVYLDVDFDGQRRYWTYREKGGIPSLAQGHAYAPIDFIYRKVPYAATDIRVGTFTQKGPVTTIGYLEMYVNFGMENEERKVFFFPCGELPFKQKYINEGEF